MSYSAAIGSDKPSARLINIIKDLYYENTKERDRIIKDVEQEFNECDQHIDQYIRKSSLDLSRLIKVFNEIAKKIEQSRSNVSNSRQALKQCKVLLQSKRDDVRRLWLEWCEQKCYYENMTKIRDLYMASETVRGLCAQKKYLEASQQIADFTKLLSSEYNEVKGLSDVAETIENERIKLEKHLLQELQEQLYTTVTKSVLESGSGSSSSSASANTAASSALMTREASFRRRFRHQLSKANDSGGGGGAQSSSSSKNTADNAALESSVHAASDDDYSETQDSIVIIERLVQAAAKLNNVDANINIVEKMINDINKSIPTQLIAMINATSNHVLESNLIDNSRLPSSNTRYKQVRENNPKYLCQLIDLVVEQFRIMARNYRHFIDCSSKLNQSRYHSGIVWNCIQNVLINLLEEYLDIGNKQANMVSAESALDRLDINSFFQRKRLINLGFGSDNTTNQLTSGAGSSNTLTSASGLMHSSGGAVSGDDSSSSRRMFTFKGSSHAMSITNYIREQNNENLFNADSVMSSSSDSSSNAQSNNAAAIQDNRTFKILVCQPAHRNITAIFSTMEHVIKDISDEIRLLPSQQETGIQKPELTLEKFVQEFILKTFITSAVESIKENARIHDSSTAQENGGGEYEISKQLIPFTKQRELGLNRPILQNILLVHQSCVDLYNLIRDMNSYASEFSRAMYTLIQRHTDHCDKLFRSVVTNHDDPNNPTHVFSMRWVLDEYIKSYFKQLPAFSSAIKGKPTMAALATVGSAANAIEVGPAVVNQQAALNAAKVEMTDIEFEILSKEVETLINNLTKNDELQDFSESDIITNFNYIEMIANLHESSDWLIVQLRQIYGSLEQMIKNPKSLNSSLSIGELNRLVKQLDELDKWRGDTMLLLYLETRMHCFYHLLSFIKTENNMSYAGDVDTDPDECVLHMNRDLHRIHEHLSKSLQEHKLNYVFDALGFMIATIFVKAIKNFKKISTHGIAKMCRNIFHVEQNLSAIRTKSDPHLMKAHRFYELLYKKPEELINHLIEHEAEFKLEDYTFMLNLIYRSQPGYEINSLSENIESLTNILKNKH